MRETYPQEVGKQEEEAGSKDEKAESKWETLSVPGSQVRFCWRQLEANSRNSFSFSPFFLL